MFVKTLRENDLSTPSPLKPYFVVFTMLSDKSNIVCICAETLNSHLKIKVQSHIQYNFLLVISDNYAYSKKLIML